MNLKLLESKVKSLESFNIFNVKELERFKNAIKTSSEWELIRINPVKFAENHNFNKNKTIDLFICGAKIGLFVFDWNLLCPMCGGIVKSLNSISVTNVDKFHCSLCDIYVDTDLSDYIEVSFDIDPSIKKINIDCFSCIEDYFRYFFSDNLGRSKELLEFQASHILDFVTIEAEKSKKITFNAEQGNIYRLTSPDNNSLLRINTLSSISDSPQAVDIEILPSAFSIDTIDVKSGEVTININNRTVRSFGALVLHADFAAIKKVFDNTPPVWKDFLTGKMLLNNQTFRDLFRIQSLPRDFKVKVSSISILFTDLKSSTELYDKKGDMYAYNLVQEHFDLLKKSVASNSGAIIKTIGDAIMASFSNPEDALKAALDMNNKINEMNNSGYDDEIAIKIGLHTGTALAVTANEILDYFGQTVNMAARVQGLAQGNEIWISKEIYDSSDVKNILLENKYIISEREAILKGIKTPALVYKCYVAR